MDIGSLLSGAPIIVSGHDLSQACPAGNQITDREARTTAAQDTGYWILDTGYML